MEAPVTSHQEAVGLDSSFLVVNSWIVKRNPPIFCNSFTVHSAFCYLTCLTIFPLIREQKLFGVGLDPLAAPRGSLRASRLLGVWTSEEKTLNAKTPRE